MVNPGLQNEACVRWSHRTWRTSETNLIGFFKKILKVVYKKAMSASNIFKNQNDTFA